MIRCLSILFCAVWVGAAEGQTTESTVGTNRPQYNFLFVIDASLSMAQRKPAAIKLVREVITSRFNGQIEPGDSIDIWTFDSENHIARFPPHLWEDVEVHRIATIAARFVDQQKFKGRSRFLPVAADLESLLPHTKNLLAIILTDAEPPLAGIHFDLEINEYAANEKKLRPGSKQPLLISLAASNGKFHEWTVYNGEGALDLATLPTRPKPLPVMAVVAPQKIAEPEKEPEPAPPVVVDYPPGTRITPILPPKAEPEPMEPKLEILALENEPVRTEIAETKPEEREVVANTAVPPTTPKPDAGNSAPEKEVARAEVKPVAKLPVEPPVVTKVEREAEPQISAPPVVTPPAVAIAKVEPEKPKSAKNHWPPKTEPPKATEPLVALTTPGLSTTAIYISITTGLSFLAIGVFLLLRRSRARHGSSIISKSLQQ